LVFAHGPYSLLDLDGAWDMYYLSELLQKSTF
jgi:hypothetical protein